MKPGDKISAIKKVATKLSELDDWSEIDLTLRAFGFPWSDMWQGQGGKYAYLVDHLEQGSEEKLKSIFEYISGEKTSEELDVKDVTGPWMTHKF